MRTFGMRVHAVWTWALRTLAGSSVIKTPLYININGCLEEYIDVDGCFENYIDIGGCLENYVDIPGEL